MITCGDIDGKPCEWWKDRCPKAYRDGVGIFASGMMVYTESEHVACHPVLALLEARAECARWKRAAERLARRDVACKVDPCLHIGRTSTGPEGVCTECRLSRALKEVP